MEAKDEETFNNLDKPNFLEYAGDEGRNLDRAMYDRYVAVENWHKSQGNFKEATLAGEEAIQHASNIPEDEKIINQAANQLQQLDLKFTIIVVVMGTLMVVACGFWIYLTFFKRKASTESQQDKDDHFRNY